MPPVKASFIADETYELYEAKLASSGITVSQANALGMTMLNPAETKQLGTWAWPAHNVSCLGLRYLDFDGVTPLRDSDYHPRFFVIEGLTSL